MSSFRIFLIVFLFFFININLSFSQVDSAKFKIGPEDLQRPGAGRYFNFADKNKVNIEVTVIGGGAAGKYLIPQGTTIFDFLIMAGGTGKQSVEDIKIVRFKSESPRLKGNEVIQLDYSDLYGDKEEILKSQPNPTLRPGDMVIIPEPKPDRSWWDYVTLVLSYVNVVLSFYYLYDLIFIR